MKILQIKKWMLTAALGLMCLGCSFTPLPEIPKLVGMYQLETFSYVPFDSGQVKKANDVLHRSGGNAYLDYDIAPYVQKINRSVFQKAGLAQGVAPYAIVASVDMLYVDDVGYTYEFMYTVTYRIISITSNKEVLKRTYTQQVAVGVYFNVNFGVSLDQLYTTCVIQFMKDVDVQHLLGWR